MESKLKISVIIPTYNEERNISQLIRTLIENSSKDSCEVIVVDGGSTDDTVTKAEREGALVLTFPRKARGLQMNFGAAQAKGDILYFVHADTIPPRSFVNDILLSVKNNYPIGCYRFQFDSDRWLLKINSYFTRFDRMMFRGGDQSLFVTKEIFNEFDGYADDHIIMEEYDFIKRVRKKYDFRIIPKNVIVSARKYDNNSYLKVNIANLIAFTMFRQGVSQDRIRGFYYKMLKQKGYERS